MMRPVAAVLLCLAALSPAAAAEPPAPDVLVRTVTLEIVDLIARDKEIRAGDRAKLIKLIEARVLPHFNFGTMTAYAMGHNWRQAAPEQRTALVAQFKTLLVRTYASALASYSDQKFDFRPLRARPTDTDVLVQVRVLQSGAQPVSIDYSMEKTAAGWKVYDITVGGVSLLQNYRTEFNAAVRRSGIDGLIKALDAKNRSLEAQGAAAAKQ